ncbi:MAG: hypothetical protein Tp118SUR00d2C21406231_49 [Prokaryotic dsDNA virus sp.]|nr:MAG: hypothetical protein Tp125DCM00d2C40298531_68 [Prokaryotic dsDNA virus sp.]QDP53169.1 MAG: hypothetical protein Tp118SUR00d2C21406231_49 [Prokaryotic dsDNA virus sp.]|tara:strand:+ start:27251 stop:27586 length:336 start_codon:yes stop_codon:yes gene_type:complete
MTRKKALTDLRDKVAAGELPPEINAIELFRRWSVFDGPNKRFADLAYWGSLDAALALHNAVLPGWRWEGGSGAGIFAVWDKPDEAHKGRSDNPARAFLLAILSALIAECDE